MEPIGMLVRPIDVTDSDDEITDGDGVRLPDWVEDYFARERAWWRFLRATGAVSTTALQASLMTVRSDERPR